MFINIDDIINDKNSWQDQLTKYSNSCDVKIQEKLEKIKKLEQQGQSKRDTLIAELCEKDPKTLTKEERRLIYDEYKIVNERINKWLSITGAKREKLPAFEDVPEEAWGVYQALVSVEYEPVSIKIESYKKELKELINQRDKIAYVQISKDTFFKDPQKVEDICNEIIKSGRNLKVVIYDNMAERSNDTVANYVYTKEEFNKLIDFNNNLRYKGMQDNIKINELSDVSTLSGYKKSWDLQMVVEANNNIDNVVKNIKSKRLTPYEAVLYIHKYITSTFAYREGDLMSENVIMGSYTDKSIICSGYSSLTKAIIDKLDYPELKCEMINCKIYQDSLVPSILGTHSQCLIHIKDEQYGINGTYLNDACWDSKQKSYPKGRGFANCLIPLADAQNFKDTIYVQIEGTSRYDALVINLKEFVKYSSSDKLRDYFSRIGLKIKKPTPAFVKKYGNQSQPIPFDVFENGLYNMVTKITGLDRTKDIDDLVKKLKENTLFFANVSFNKNASNCFIKYIDEKNIKFNKKDQQKAQKNQNNPIVKE